MKAETNRTLRRVHLYLGVFFAPAIIFFALSGALQTFRLHEAEGYGGPPPEWLVWSGSVHKNAAVPHAGDDGDHDHGDAADHDHDHGDAADHDHDHADAAAPLDERKDAKPHDARSALPVKIFVTLMSIGLVVSALLGIVLALANRATRRVSAAMLATGMVLPLALLLF